MPPRLGYLQLKEYLENTGSKLLTPECEYKNSYNQKLDILCIQGHKDQKTYKAYRKHDCSICHPKSKKYNISDLKEIAQTKGDTLLSDEYIDAHTPLLFKCKNPEHEPYYSLWTTYKRSQCRKCAYEEIKLTEKEIKDKIEFEQYSVLNFLNNDIPSKQEIEVRCNKQHEAYITTWNRWLNKKRCPYCSPFALKTIDALKQELQENYLTLIVDDNFNYTGNLTPIKAICKNGHITSKPIQAFKLYGCSECSTAGKSSAEIWIKNHFSEYSPVHRYKVKLNETGKTMELDLYFPEHRLAIEYCGLYWHGSKKIISEYSNESEEKLNTKLQKNIYRHQRKKVICDSIGITLLTIFEDEFMTKRDIVISRICHKLGIIKKVYARDCDISEVSKEEADTFLNSYHLQNSTPFEFGLKLTRYNEIVAVMTFGKSLPKNSEIPNDWELKRYCTATRIQITGGAQRLFKHAVDEARRRKISAIFTYCDLRWGNGSVYKSLGFDLIKEISSPSPHVVRGMSRIRTRHIEDENVIYDCGHQKWLFKL